MEVEKYHKGVLVTNNMSDAVVVHLIGERKTLVIKGDRYDHTPYGNELEFKIELKEWLLLIYRKPMTTHDKWEEVIPYEQTYAISQLLTVL